MAKALIYNEADAAFRHAIYQFIVTRGHIPKLRELDATLSRPKKTLRAGLHRLAQLHILVLQPQTSQILRAAPFWAVPTGFQVQSGKHAWWASCIWDALAIPAMLRRDARMSGTRNGGAILFTLRWQKPRQKRWGYRPGCSPSTSR